MSAPARSARLDASAAHAAKRLILAGRGSESLREPALRGGFTVVDKSNEADFVLVYGGDGSLLGADREFPNLPKLILRREEEFSKCARHATALVLERVARGQQCPCLLPRLRAEVNGVAIHAINDIVFHNSKVTIGVRYRVRIDDEPYADEVVGDGLVVATPFGSSAYYRSITKSVFRVGIGLAFNNSTESVNHLVLNDDAHVEVEVTRGPGILVGDNIPEPVEVDRGDIIRIAYSQEAAEIWDLDTLLCMDCRSLETGKSAGFRHV